MQLAVEIQIHDDNQNSPIVQTAFFKSQPQNKNVLSQENENGLAWVTEQNRQIQLKKEALRLQQEAFENQYRRLERICNNMKQASLAEQAAIPVLVDPKDYKASVNSVNKMTSAIDHLLKEVAVQGRAHRENTAVLDNLRYDLELTSNLLSSPTEENMKAFQTRTSQNATYPCKQPITNAMIAINLCLLMAATVVAVASIIAIVSGFAIPVAAVVGCLACDVMRFSAVAHYGLTAFKGISSAFSEHPIVSDQKIIANEINQKNYLTPPPSFGR